MLQFVYKILYDGDNQTVHNWSEALGMEGFSISLLLIEPNTVSKPENSNNTRLINICTFYANYFIDTHKIKGNNNFEFFGYLTYLKYVLMIEERICITKHQEKSIFTLTVYTP